MDKSDRKLVFRWAILSALTLFSFESAWGFAWLQNQSVAIAVVIAVAMLKVRIVILDFMEVREAPWTLRGLIEGWVVAITCGILAFWYAAGA